MATAEVQEHRSVCVVLSGLLTRRFCRLGWFSVSLPFPVEASDERPLVLLHRAHKGEPAAADQRAQGSGWTGLRRTWSRAAGAVPQTPRPGGEEEPPGRRCAAGLGVSATSGMRLSDFSLEGAPPTVKTMTGVCVGSGNRRTGEPARPGGARRPLTVPAASPAQPQTVTAGRAAGPTPPALWTFMEKVL